MSVPSQTYCPANLQDRAAWLDNFAAQFTLQATTLGFLPADVTSLNADNDEFQFAAEATVTLDAYIKAFRVWRKNVSEGEIGSPEAVFPSNPTVAPPHGVPVGIFERLDNLIRRIKASPQYTPEIGSALGIIPESPVRPAPDTVQPTIKASSLPGSIVQVRFVRQNMTGVVIETKLDNSETWSSQGVYNFSPAELVIPTNSPNLPRAVQVRARYIDKNTPVGQYSQVDTVATVPSV